MKRYQIYLNPQSVATIDDITRLLGVSRSQIIQDVVDRVAREYKKLLRARTKPSSDNPLLKMAGFAKSPTGSVSQNVDEIYLRD